MRPMKITKYAIIVTGGSSGLGEATCNMIASVGGVPIIFDINEQRGQALAGEVNGAFYRVDVRCAVSYRQCCRALWGYLWAC